MFISSFLNDDFYFVERNKFQENRDAEISKMEETKEKATESEGNGDSVVSDVKTEGKNGDSTVSEVKTEDAAADEDEPMNE